MDPYKIGENHELSESDSKRVERGAWYTPRKLVEQLVEVVWEHSEVNDQIFIDPTCGGGAFLLAVADRLVADGIDPADVLKRLHGLDIDRGAVEACRQALLAWAQTNGCSSSDVISQLEEQIQCGDALAGFPSNWKSRRIYIGNPPFGTPLKSNSSELANDYRKQRKSIFGPYADRSSLHFVNCLENAEPGTAILMIMPLSVVATKHLERFRELLNSHDLKAMWVADAPMFEASVKTCAVLVEVVRSEVEASDEPVALYYGEALAPQSRSNSRTWAELAADAVGVPQVPDINTPSFRSLIEATAGFRDEYYGLAEVCVENKSATEDVVRLATTGMIGLLSCSWGNKQTRFAKQRFDQPVVPKVVADKKVQNWITRQESPKVLIPTQSKVLKPFVDLEAEYVATTPVLIVTGQDLFGFVAALFSPVLNLIAYRQNYGAGLSTSAIKLSAAGLVALPQPVDTELWAQGRKLVEDVVGGTPSQADLVELAAIMNSAYGGDEATLAWWLDRAF